jgi:hypothetical protein
MGFIKKVAMKYIKYCWLFMLLSNAVYALKTVYLPAELQTHNPAPFARTLYVKLPLQQTDRDWVFTDAESLLAGALELRIIRNDQLAEQILIFANGKWSEGWFPLVPPVPTTPHAIYFGFISSKAYLTAPGDKIEMRLQVVKPLKGIGPDSSGILAPGLYVTSGDYAGLTDNFNLSGTQLYNMVMQDDLSLSDKQILIQDLFNIYNYAAFLNAWTTAWPLSTTTNSGWLNEYNQPEQGLL